MSKIHTYDSFKQTSARTSELAKIQSVRLIETTTKGFDVFLVVLFLDDGRVDTRSFFSLAAAQQKVNELAPKLAPYVQLESTKKGRI